MVQSTKRMNREEEPLLLAVSFSKLMETFKKILKRDYDVNEMDTDLKRINISYTSNNNKDLMVGVKRLEYGEDHENNTHFNISKSVRHIRFNNSFNRGKVIDMLNNNIKSLGLGNGFNDTIKKFPFHLRKINFGNSFNKAGIVEILPKNVVKIKLGNSFNQYIKSFPDNLRSIDFGDSFNQSGVLESLPNRIEKIKLGNSFNKSIIDFPYYLEYIEFGNSFNQSGAIEALKDKVRYIKLGTAFKYPIKKIPKSLKILEFKGLSINSSTIPTLINTKVKVIYRNRELTFDKVFKIN